MSPTVLPEPEIKIEETVEEQLQPSTAVSKIPLMTELAAVVKKKTDKPRARKSSKLKKQKVPVEGESEDQDSLKIP